MTSFRFPPPPPPPPKADDAAQHYETPGQRGESNNTGRGRGWRGRGQSGRGRGGNNRGNARGGNGYNSGRSEGNRQVREQVGQLNNAQESRQNLPPGSYVNPQFQWSGAGQPQPNPIAVSQTRVPTLSPHMSNGRDGSSAGQNTGKRKRDMNQTSDSHQNQTRSMHPLQSPRDHRKLNGKPPYVKAATAPAVPSFGFTLPPSVNRTGASKSGQDGTASSRKSNLGLTPRDEAEKDDSGSDEEDIDEEAVYGKNFNG